jgi:Protein of unknown function (DUF3140)
MATHHQKSHHSHEHHEVDERLWEEFHRRVNMTSRELEEWLRTAAAGQDHEALPDEAGGPRGQELVHLLGKRRGDVTAADERLLRSTVDRIDALLGDRSEPTAGDERWRHRLMSLGHDPLKSSSAPRSWTQD